MHENLQWDIFLQCYWQHIWVLCVICLGVNNNSQMTCFKILETNEAFSEVDFNFRWQCLCWWATLLSCHPIMDCCLTSIRVSGQPLGLKTAPQEESGCECWCTFVSIYTHTQSMHKSKTMLTNFPKLVLFLHVHFRDWILEIQWDWSIPSGIKWVWQGFLQCCSTGKRFPQV